MNFKLKSFGLFFVIVVALSGQQACGMSNVMRKVGQTLANQLPSNTSLGLQEPGTGVDKNQGSWLFSFIKRHPGKIFCGLTLCGIGAVGYNFVIGSDLAKTDSLMKKCKDGLIENYNALGDLDKRFEKIAEGSKKNIRSLEDCIRTMDVLLERAKDLPTLEGANQQREALGGLCETLARSSQNQVNKGVPPVNGNALLPRRGLNRL